MSMKMRYYIPTEIHFGAGKLDVLGKLPLPGQKALIVTSAGQSVIRFGYLQRVQDLLAQNGCSSVVFNKIQPNPTHQHVMEGAAVARAQGCDFVIGLGGGSSIDSAKSIAVMATNPGDYWDYISGGSGKGQPLKAKPLPVVAITTTAGTGTEADPWTVITKEDTCEKIGFGNDQTFPVLSIVDPELMTTVPPDLTAYQGFDALFHSTEGYIANCANVFSDLYALKAIELIFKFLPVAVREPDNLEARSMVALANTLSGMVESTSSCTSEHSLEHAISAHFPNVPHGAGLIMVSLAYYKHFVTFVPERMVAMARAAGAKNVERAQDFVDALAGLQIDCGVDQLKMSDYGIKPDDLEKFTANARATMGGLFAIDPVELCDADVLEIYRDAYR